MGGPAPQSTQCSQRAARMWCPVRREGVQAPCVLPVADSSSRRAQVYDTVWERAARRHGITGSLYWHCSANSYPDHDGYTVYLQPAEPPDPDDARVLALIQGHARAMSGCNALPLPEAANLRADTRKPNPLRSPSQMLQSLGQRIRNKLEQH